MNAFSVEKAIEFHALFRRRRFAFEDIRRMGQRAARGREIQMNRKRKRPPREQGPFLILGAGTGFEPVTFRL